MTQQAGAEAVLTFSENSVHKERLVKPYRHPELDLLLRSKRNRKEAKILASSPVRSPKLLSSDAFSLTMERIHGKTLRETLNSTNAAHFGEIVGKLLKTLHDADIIHGDLTTSNILVEDKTKSLVLIDFGLSQTSKREEDRAVDLHVLKETIQGTHTDCADVFWDALLVTYQDRAVLDALTHVEIRGRNKRH